VVTVKNLDNQKSIGFVYGRQGLVNWKLTALRLPI
jgi:hypothetical protein